MDAAKRILAIESSGRHGSVALLNGDDDTCLLVSHYAESGGERTAQSLAPSIKQLLSEANWTPTTVDLVAVAIGPGSFTGLRIGVTTAKAFAYACGAEVVGVNTLQVIATQSPKSSAPLCVVSDAQRQELFAAKYTIDGTGALQSIRDTCILSQDAWVATLRSGDRATGPALVRLQSRLPTDVEVVSKVLWRPTAESVGRLAWLAYRSGQRDDVWKLTPQYYRTSAAEEKNPV
jgi:tRNA threonylcarbamoyladenosine biosynthesis protein TsaB